MRHPPPHGSNHLWLIWKESIQNCRCYKADTAGGTDGRMDGWTDGRTDGQTDGVKPIYPPTTSLFGGYNNTVIVLVMVYTPIIIQSIHVNPCKCHLCNDGNFFKGRDELTNTTQPQYAWTRKQQERRSSVLGSELIKCTIPHHYQWAMGCFWVLLRTLTMSNWVMTVVMCSSSISFLKGTCWDFDFGALN